MTLKDRLTPEQLALIDEDGKKYTYTSQAVYKSLEKTYVIDLTVYEAIRITSILNVPLTDIFNIFKK